MDIEVLEATLTADTARVELTARRLGEERYRVTGRDGACEFVRTAGGFETVLVEGVDPIGDRSTDRFLGAEAERSARFPAPEANAYPYARERIAAFFDHPNAPDVFVARTAAFHVHGNLGEHGSLGAVQSRAAFVAGGKGIATHGIVDRHLQAVDIAPTIAAALGCEPDGDGRYLAAQDGVADTRLLDGNPARHVLAFLFDGLNANLLVEEIEAGNVATLGALVERGTCYREGSIASLPSVTLPNHTTLLTGLHPGHHGVLSNSWYERDTDRTPNLLDFAQMPFACNHLLPGVETLFEAVARHRPGAFTATTYEYADRGADWSTWAQSRAGEPLSMLPAKDRPIPHASLDWVENERGYRFQSRIDASSTNQACALLESGEHPTPTFLWVNYSLTDEAGHHGGPHGDEVRAALRDTDARMGEVLRAAERVGILDDTAVFMCADHGMERTDPAIVGHYRDALDAAELDYRDVDDGLIYVDS